MEAMNEPKEKKTWKFRNWKIHENPNKIVSLQVSRLPRRQLFLVRNIRKFKLRNALNKSPSTESLSSTENANVKDTFGDDAKSATKSTTSSSQVSTTTIESASVNIDSVLGSNESDIVLKSTVTAAVTNETVSSTTVNR